MRLAPGATRTEAREEVCKLFAEDSLRSVPLVLVWWEDMAYEKTVSIAAWKMRKALGLK